MEEIIPKLILQRYRLLNEQDVLKDIAHWVKFCNFAEDQKTELIARIYGLYELLEDSLKADQSLVVDRLDELSQPDFSNFLVVMEKLPQEELEEKVNILLRLRSILKKDFELMAYIA